MTLGERFGENLRRIRRGTGLSQEAVALRASLHRTEISALERGLKEPRLKTILKLCAAVETEPGKLLAGMEWLPAAEVKGRFDIPQGRFDLPDLDATL